jgi:uncharacterized protein YndB with AHSA1/START domain
MKTIHHVVDIDAVPGRVWSALTDPADLAGWWGTKVEQAGGSGVGSRLNWTFAGDFNPVMEITTLEDGTEVGWVCVSGHEPWQDGRFRFRIAGTGDGQTRLRFWQEYAVELADDYYGVYNFDWGYYLESLRLLCVTGTGKPFQAED